MYEHRMKPVVVCIPTTPERRDRLAVCMESINTYAGYPCIIMTHENEYEGFIVAIHRILDRLADDTLIWVIGDDVTMHEPDTMKRMVEAYDKMYPDHDGVVNPNDGIQRGALITAPLTTAKIMRDGTSKEFFHSYADNLFTDRMKCLGKYTYLPDIHVTHNHHCNGLAKKDHTYAIASEHLQRDYDIYQRLSITRDIL